jgi:SAM-dependent methyltransferase
VVAVEPSAGMREQLARLLPQVDCRDGTAEAIPVPDDSIDVVLCAQAWHWVDPHRAVPEVARVLSRGGRLGLIWNKRDERVDWVKQLGRIMHGDDSRAEIPVVGPPFAPLERCDFEWTYLLPRAAMVDLVASRSYVITLPAEARSALLAAVRQLIDTHPGLSRATEISLPYIAECHRTDLASPGK